MSTLQPGDLAPEVALPDDHGITHRLSEQRGRWIVLYFYPEDDTPNCTTEACQFRDLNDSITAADAEVWGVSPDSAASHAAFRAKFGLPFTLLSDVDREAISAYGVWGPKLKDGREIEGVIRTTYLVDPQGRIARVWPKVKADGHAGAVLAALAETRSGGS
jgi:peroxiredoxin Q/BCP